MYCHGLMYRHDDVNIVHCCVFMTNRKYQMDEVQMVEWLSHPRCVVKEPKDLLWNIVMNINEFLSNIILDG
jgi:hypothetical protein